MKKNCEKKFDSNIIPLLPSLCLLQKKEKEKLKFVKKEKINITVTKVLNYKKKHDLNGIDVCGKLKCQGTTKGHLRTRAGL